MTWRRELSQGTPLLIPHLVASMTQCSTTVICRRSERRCFPAMNLTPAASPVVARWAKLHQSWSLHNNCLKLWIIHVEGIRGTKIQRGCFCLMYIVSLWWEVIYHSVENLSLRLCFGVYLRCKFMPTWHVSLICSLVIM